MSNNGSICWPEAFSKNTTNFLDEPIEHVLALQLCAWGNLYVGVPAPTNFFEVMDAASVVTQAFTPEECKSLFHDLIEKRRNSNNPDSEE